MNENDKWIELQQKLLAIAEEANNLPSRSFSQDREQAVKQIQFAANLCHMAFFNLAVDLAEISVDKQ